MKNKFKPGNIWIILLSLFPLSLEAQNPTYLLELRNDIQVSSTVYEFDIYLLRTGVVAFEYAQAQFGILVNPQIKNGGTLTALIVEGSADQSLITTNQNPTNSNYYDPSNVIRISPRTPPGAGNGAIISNVSPGTRICRIRLANTVAFAQYQPNLVWTIGAPWPTQMYAYVEGVNTNVVNHSNHTTNNLANPVLNSVSAPAAYSVTGTGSYCAGSGGLPVGLAGSETGVTYTLYRGAVAQTPTVSGTGVSISFGNQLEGTYTVTGTNLGGTTAMTGNAVITENATPPAPTGSTSQTFCSGQLPTVASLVATGSSILWYSSPSGGSPLASNTTLVNGAHYYASQTVAGCESTARLNVTAVVNTTPAAPTGTSTQIFCSGDSPTIADLVMTGTSVLWYSALTDGAPLSPGTALTNGSHYYASQTVNGCESTSRFLVTVVVYTTPSAPTGNTSQGFCSGDSPTVADLVATGAEIKWYSTPTGGTALASGTALINGNHYYASQTFSGCESLTRLNVTVTVLTTPVVTDQTTAILTGQTFTVTPTGAGVPAGTTYTWTAPTVLPSTLTGGTAQSTPQTSISGTLYLPSGAGTATYTVTPHNGTCIGNTFTVTVIVTSSCVAATVDTQPEDDEMCAAGSASFTVTVDGTSPVTYRWQYYNGTSWVNTSNNNPSRATYSGATTATLNISGIEAVGNYQYRCSITNCSTVNITSNAVILTVNPLPSAPVIGSVVHPTCTTSTGSVTISSPAGAGMTYSINGTNYTNTTGVFNNVTAGTYTVTARSASGCTSSGTSVTVNPQPVTPAAPTVTLVHPTCTVATGTITITAPSGSGMTYSINNSVYQASNVFSAVSSGPYTVTARSSAGCVSPGTIVTINAQPLTPTVVTNDPSPVCSPNTVNLTAPAVTAGSTNNLTFTYWTNAQATTAYATPVTAGNGIYYIKGTNASGCYDVEPVTVIVNPTPAANAGTGGNACDLDFQLNATASIGIGTWTMTSGPGTAVFSPSANNPHAIVTVSVYGTYTFTWTEVNGSCSNSNVITVNFYEQPVANAGTGGNNCGLVFHLTGSMNVGTGLWTRVSGPGSATFASSASEPDATVTVSAYGSYVFRWTVTNGTCTNSATVNVTFVQQPAADAGNGGEECDMNFTLNAVTGASTGSWSNLSGPGDAVFTNASLPNSTVTVTLPGTYEFAWTIQNVSCRSSDVVTVIFRELPAVSAGSDITICEGTSANLLATGNGSFMWTPSSTLSNPDVANPIASPLATTSYTVTITDEFGCTSTDEVEVAVCATPIANAGPDQVLEFVMETNLAAAPLTSLETGTWSVIAGSGSIAGINDPDTRVTDLAVGPNEFRWTVDNGVCPPVSDDVIIMVNELIIPTLITPDHGDEYNEYFVIRGIQSMGRSSLTVFDKRGMRVFENANYNNDWNGVDHNNTDLPEDTYYYVLKTQNGKTFKGFVVIKR